MTGKDSARVSSGIRAFLSHARPPFRRRFRSGEYAENNIDSDFFQIDLIEALLGGQVVKGDMGRFFSLLKGMPHPIEILFELRFANPSKPHPHPSFIQHQEAAAPAEQR